MLDRATPLLIMQGVEDLNDLCRLQSLFDIHKKDLQLALDRGFNTHSIVDVFKEVISKEAAFLGNERGFVVTQVYRCPKRNVLHLWLAGGDLDTVRHLVKDIIVPQARPNLDCTVITIDGRLGWLRALQDDRWKQCSTVMAMEV